ncbi:MAG TPA: hypothetical protein DCL72_04735 [Rhizobiales bacterium]|jgi:hypothetical protein|nr:hypothetical protein [Hyphomicrobiales bacterium]HBR26263.1 hypothetical protein [Hyphomicrobiales bacterium]HCL61592.1 hypothetical protein [Hyphomicrobiales bacterium]
MTKTAKPHLPLGKSMILGLLASGAVLGGTAFLPAGALAGDPAYVGKWAATLALCKNGQEMEIAPLLVTTSGYDQHEGHCTFKSKPKAIKAGGWRVKVECSVEGDKQTHDVKLSVKGGRLTLRDENAAHMFERCP